MIEFTELSGRKVFVDTDEVLAIEELEPLGNWWKLTLRSTPGAYILSSKEANSILEYLNGLSLTEGEAEAESDDGEEWKHPGHDQNGEES